jgi:hypothetical protein
MRYTPGHHVYPMVFASNHAKANESHSLPPMPPEYPTLLVLDYTQLKTMSWVTKSHSCHHYLSRESQRCATNQWRRESPNLTTKPASTCSIGHHGVVQWWIYRVQAQISLQYVYVFLKKKKEKTCLEKWRTLTRPALARNARLPRVEGRDHTDGRPTRPCGRSHDHVHASPPRLFESPCHAAWSALIGWTSRLVWSSAPRRIAKDDGMAAVAWPHRRHIQARASACQHGT